MPSETVVLDSGNLAAIIQDATGEPLEEEKPAPVTPRAAEPAAAAAASTPAAARDEDGLTEEERKTFTEKIRKSISWRHGKMREAQEEAQRERQGRLAAEQRASAVERDLEQLRVQPRAAEKGAEAPKEPKLEDFATTDEYIAARVKWDVDQALGRERESRRKEAEQAERERLIGSARERIAKAIELVPDFKEVTEGADMLVPPHIAGYMQESEMLPELGYFFAQHPDELERLSKMKPAQSLVALGKIESKIQPFAAPVRAAPKVEARGASPKPSTEADGNPSRPRVTVPVIQPLTARGAPEVETSATDGRSAVSSFERRAGVSLTRRSRH